MTLDKLVIGKPATSGDASNGFMDTSTLASCVGQAKSQGWDGGVMVWEVRLIPVDRDPRACADLCTCLLFTVPRRCLVLDRDGPRLDVP